MAASCENRSNPILTMPKVLGFFEILIAQTLLATSMPAAGAAQDPMPLTRLTSPIELDGRLDEAGWQTVPPLPITVYGPTFQAPPTEKT